MWNDIKGLVSVACSKNCWNAADFTVNERIPMGYWFRESGHRNRVRAVDYASTDSESSHSLTSTIWLIAMPNNILRRSEFKTAKDCVFGITMRASWRKSAINIWGSVNSKVAIQGHVAGDRTMVLFVLDLSAVLILQPLMKVRNVFRAMWRWLLMRI